jgi:uncharacterized protein (DUF2147 family)
LCLIASEVAIIKELLMADRVLEIYEIEDMQGQVEHSGKNYYKPQKDRVFNMNRRSKRRNYN